jgi:hypothetical protein
MLPPARSSPGNRDVNVIDSLCDRCYPKIRNSGFFHLDTGIERKSCSETLMDPVNRAEYDAGYENQKNKKWQMPLAEDQPVQSAESDYAIRIGILSILYDARRQDVENPNIGMWRLARMRSRSASPLPLTPRLLTERGLHAEKRLWFSYHAPER